jgi:hypothetical protein
LLKVLRSERERPDGSAIDGLAGGGISGIHSLHFGLDLDILLYRLRVHLGDDAGGFRDAHPNVRDVPLGEAGADNRQRISPYRQERSRERAIGVGLDRTLQNSCALVGDADFGVGNAGAAGILHAAANGAGGAALSEGLGEECGDEKTYRNQPDL